MYNFIIKLQLEISRQPMVQLLTQVLTTNNYNASRCLICYKIRYRLLWLQQKKNLFRHDSYIDSCLEQSYRLAVETNYVIILASQLLSSQMKISIIEVIPLLLIFYQKCEEQHQWLFVCLLLVISCLFVVASQLDVCESI